jgi:large subunit ribosomal protein L6
MSLIGKRSIPIPEGVHLDIGEGRVEVKGPLGNLTVTVPDVLAVEMSNGTCVVRPRRETKNTSALWGLTRALIANAVEGVSKGFTKRLVLEGIGYRATLEGETLVLALGFSHPVRIDPPPGIRFSVEKNIVTVSGIDKELVGNVAAAIRKLRKPEPYKGKGIRYEGEVIRRKAGKKAAAAK